MNIYDDNIEGNKEREKVSIMLTVNDLLALQEIANEFSGNISQAARMMIHKGYTTYKDEKEKQKNLFIP